MNYVCTNCGEQCDEIGNPGAVVDPVAKTLGIVCIKCRLAACAERSKSFRQNFKTGGAKLKLRPPEDQGNLPYKDE